MRLGIEKMVQAASGANTMLHLHLWHPRLSINGQSANAFAAKKWARSEMPERQEVLTVCKRTVVWADSARPSICLSCRNSGFDFRQHFANLFGKFP
jgi:hypothetical protein